MDDRLFFSEQHLQVREMVRDFAVSEVAPIAREYDQRAEFPWPTVRKMADLGLLGVPWPEELGGAGMDYLSYIITVHELCKVETGKTIVSEKVCNDLGLPVILVTKPFTDISGFINSIEQDIVIFFDEFEKIYEFSGPNYMSNEDGNA